MNKAQGVEVRSKSKGVFKIVRRVIGIITKSFCGITPKKVSKHYLYPLLIDRKPVPVDPKNFFERIYQRQLFEKNRKFSDGIMLSTDDPLYIRYHYSLVENSILSYWAAHTYCASSKGIPAKPHVLDIGSGPGHWIDFYLTALQAKSCTGIDISKTCVEKLKLKYQNMSDVNIVEADISSSRFDLKREFNIINAIGVMFHIVDDGLWQQAVENIARHLTKGGLAVISGQFGWITQNVQFTETGDLVKSSQIVLVNKRIRSLRAWRKCVKKNGLRIESLRRTRELKKLQTPENNIIILSRYT